MELFNLEQLQEKLGISDRTLLRYLANGELTGVKIGREWRFTEEDIAAFVATRRKKTEDELAEKRQRTGKRKAIKPAA